MDEDPVARITSLKEGHVSCRRDRDIKGYSAAMGIDKEEFIERFAKGGTRTVILDLGSGLGRFVDEVNGLGISGVTCLGVDMFPHTKNTTKAEFSQLPIADESVDTAFGIATIGMYAESEDHLEANIRELRRVLKKGGHAIIVLENATHFNLGNRSKEMLEHYKANILRERRFNVHPLTSFRTDFFECDVLGKLQENDFNLKEVYVPEPGIHLANSITVELEKVSPISISN